MTTSNRWWDQRHYNAVAKELREQFVESDEFNAVRRRAVRDQLVRLSFRFARRFKKDNPDFDVLRWLDQCSPNPDLYPFSELWEDDEQRD